MAVTKRHGRGPHSINERRTAELLDEPLAWKAIETLAQFIEDNYEGEGCYRRLRDGLLQAGRRLSGAQADQEHGPTTVAPNPMKAVDLSCGAGGPTRGLMQARFSRGGRRYQIRPPTRSRTCLRRRFASDHACGSMFGLLRSAQRTEPRRLAHVGPIARGRAGPIARFAPLGALEGTRLVPIEIAAIVVSTQAPDFLQLWRCVSFGQAMP
jgi:hypothetical protein